MKTIEKVANANSVTIVQRTPLGDRLVVEISAVAAAHVFDKEFALKTQNAGMLAADGEIVGGQNDIAVRIPPEKNAILIKGDAPVGIVSFDNEQISHGVPRAPNLSAT